MEVVVVVDVVAVASGIFYFRNVTITIIMYTFDLLILTCPVRVSAMIAI